jgi:DNA-binding transcriptional regulator YiaG
MPSTLSPEDVIKIRKSLGYSVEQFAKLVDVSFETVRSWESGRRGCKGPAALLIRLLSEYSRSDEIVTFLEGR